MAQRYGQTTEIIERTILNKQQYIIALYDSSKHIILYDSNIALLQCIYVDNKTWWEHIIIEEELQYYEDHPEEKIPAVELILTRLHAGAKFSN